jgi:hypothetical protein
VAASHPKRLLPGSVMSLWISYNGRNHLSRLTIKKSTKKIKNNVVLTTTDERKALSDTSWDFKLKSQRERRKKEISPVERKMKCL